MIFKKSDFSRVLDAERGGMVLFLDNTGSRNQTDLSRELSYYFRSRIRGYVGMFSDGDEDEILDELNGYFEDKGIDQTKLTFHYADSSDVVLLKITENLELKVLIVDEYHGDGDYDRYVEIASGLITEKATKADIDHLISLMSEIEMFQLKLEGC